jgi:hypothetical protein
MDSIILSYRDAQKRNYTVAESDTFDKVDQVQARLNAAIAAAVIWGFANSSERLPRQTHDEIQALIDNTDLPAQMLGMAVWDGWADGTRGRHD